MLKEKIKPFKTEPVDNRHGYQCSGKQLPWQFGAVPEARLQLRSKGLLHETPLWTQMLHMHFRFWRHRNYTSHNAHISHYVVISFSPAHQYGETSSLEMKNASINHRLICLLPKHEVPLQCPHRPALGWQCPMCLLLCFQDRSKIEERIPTLEGLQMSSSYPVITWKGKDMFFIYEVSYSFLVF